MAWYPVFDSDGNEAWYYDDAGNVTVDLPPAAVVVPVETGGSGMTYPEVIAWPNGDPPLTKPDSIDIGKVIRTAAGKLFEYKRASPGAPAMRVPYTPAPMGGATILGLSPAMLAVAAIGAVLLLKR